MARFYENTDQSEKALLALDELSKRVASTIPKAKIQFAQVKNHFRVTNYYQAKKIRADIDNDYKSQLLDKNNIYEALYYTTGLQYDRHILDELTYIGEIQKYFIYIMESDLSPENEKLTELLVLYYDGFLEALHKKSLAPELKQQLTVSILDQLRKFEKFKMDEGKNPRTLARFSTYADTQQKKLTERLHNEN